MSSAPPLILVVDDSTANRDTLVALLEGEGCRSVQAADGFSALRLAAEAPPDLILLDVMMPDMDGFEVCRRLRADPRLAEVPVIMITALDDQSARIAGLEAGADEFVTKPFNRAELRVRVRTIARLNRYRRLVESQAALRASEARFQLLADHSDEVFWFVALNPRRLIYVSPAVERVWGVSAAEFLKDPAHWEKSIHPDDRARVSAAFGAAAAGETGHFAEEYRIVRPDGTARWVMASGTPIRDGLAAVASIGGVARDITQRKETDDRLLRAQRLENLGMLAAGIAHDFNNALAPIVMAGPLLRLNVSDLKALRLLDTVERSAERSVALVQQLLSFARGAQGRTQLLQIRHVLREVVELAEATFSKSIRVESRLPGDLWPVEVNATQIHQVFLNLLVNARDAMPQGGELTVAAANCPLDAVAAAAIAGARAGAFLTVEVRDTGTGIAPDLLARIWEPFFTTKGEGCGTGLGLSTVRGILHNHDGFATVATRPGHGTKFTIYLPAKVAAPAAGALQPQGTLPPRGAGELILVVDDEEPVRFLAAQVLADHGYRTVTAGDGAEAIAVFAPQAATVRLLLTDLQMPVLGGVALATTLRRLQPGLPVIAMSGVDRQTSAVDQHLVAAFLAKPFQAETLLALVRRTLDANRPLPPVRTG